MSLLDPGFDLLIEIVEGASEWAREVGDVGKDSAQTRAQDAVVGSGEKQGRTQTKIRKLVTVSAGDPLNDPMQAKSPQMIGHLSRG